MSDSREFWAAYDREKEEWRREDEAKQREFENSIAGKQCRIREERLAFYNSLSHDERVAYYNEMQKKKISRM